MSSIDKVLCSLLQPRPNEFPELRSDYDTCALGVGPLFAAGLGVDSETWSKLFKQHEETLLYVAFERLCHIANRVGTPIPLTMSVFCRRSLYIAIRALEAMQSKKHGQMIILEDLFEKDEKREADGILGKLRIQWRLQKIAEQTQEIPQPGKVSSLRAILSQRTHDDI